MIIQYFYCKLHLNRLLFLPQLSAVDIIHFHINSFILCIMFNSCQTILSSNTTCLKYSFSLKWGIFLMQKYPFIPARDIHSFARRFSTKIFYGGPFPYTFLKDVSKFSTKIFYGGPFP